MSDLVGNPEDRFSHNETHTIGMVNKMYPPELQLNEANASDVEAFTLDLTSIYFLMFFFCFVFRPKVRV